MKLKERQSFRGTITIRDPKTGVVETFKNKVVFAGLEDIVDKLQGAGNINDYHYIAFGTDGTTTIDADVALHTEVAGGAYARLDATQGEGGNARTYRLSGIWTNNSGGVQLIAEVGILTAAGAGTLLARSCVDDDGWTAKSIDDAGTLEIVSWDLALADA